MVLSIIIYSPCLVIVSMCFSFMFKRKETAIGVLTTLFILLILIPFMTVSFSSMGRNTEISKELHLIFTFLDPFYAVIGVLYKIFEVKNYFFTSRNYTKLKYFIFWTDIFL